MTKIYLGPAGVPSVSKGRSSLDGVKTVSELGLNAMEVEFVRGVKMSLEMAKQLGELAKQLKVRLSVHAPYYVNLSSTEKEKINASKKRILDSVERADVMGADIVVIHAGYYGKLSEEETYQKIKKACLNMREELIAMGIKNVRLGLETTGKISQFGTLEEIIQICREIKICSPVIDFAHLYARSAGKIDYSQIFNKVLKLKPKHLHTHFSGIKFSPVKATGKGNERYHLPIESNAPPFKPLAREILERKIDITIISESPILEQDSLVMKNIFEKLGYSF